jgi:hypothetical protein
MKATYKIIGQDGREYGPATSEQVRQWIAEGRVDSQTPLFAEGATEWTRVGLWPEFAGSFAAGKELPRGSKTNGNALAGIIFGALSITFCCCFPFGIVGLIFSLIGLSQIRTNPEGQSGRGLALAGVVLSALSLALGAGALLFNLATGHLFFLWNAVGF